ncbi:MAG: DEAD/DEAH box helicase [Chitinophagaceae bacterium]
MSSKQKTIFLNTDAASGKSDYQVALLLNFSNERKGGFSIDPLMMWNTKGYKTFKRIPFDNDQHLSYLRGLPLQVITALKKVMNDALINHLADAGFAYLRTTDNPVSQLGEKHHETIQALMYNVILELKPFVPMLTNIFHLPATEKFADNTVKPASISMYAPALQFKLQKQNGQVQLQCLVSFNNNLFPLQEFEPAGFFLRHRNEYFLLKKEDVAVVAKFAHGPLAASLQKQADFIEQEVKPLVDKYEVDLGDIIRRELIEGIPQAKVYLSELNENFLMIRPRWQYEHLEVQDEEAETVVEEDAVIYTIQRNQQVEKKLVNDIRNAHSNFSNQFNGYFYLSFKDALRNNWFLDFYNRLLDADVPVYGMQDLKKFKYNKHKPVLKILPGNRIDWFDLTIEVSYGDLVVPLSDLRKAIINKQQYIMLSDGSMGMLPPEWIEKYSLLMQMSQVKDGQLRVSKYNWVVLDEVKEQLADNNMQAELDAKKDLMQQVVGAGSKYVLPTEVKASLRDYQQAGFQWLCMLDDMGWGGCLADDMGLGKTLQTISFLQYIALKYPDETHLVVCPTSLIYNWEAELQKFAPGLSYYIHYGGDREFDEQKIAGTRIVISSYGIVRGDIEHFSRVNFGYVILDESHAIKNPASQVAKAIYQLNARNRIAISGTPLQNNTMDLYAQIQFVNPGMLGNQEFFKTTFANPIDKSGNAEKAGQLKKLIYPFMLRRTKEQVAKDLPDKTEMILWCEMGEEQRKIYNSYKEHYRQNILEHIEADGIAKSSIFILDGLTKLRQICDSPALLKDHKEYNNSSAKLDELMREIEENTGEHKVLIFSQFTSMLQLIKGALEQQQVPFHYLDGGTAAEDRKDLVERFQQEEDTRVFLISLKAGGVGLTLTAADYVYLVDPWWNPAAEQQAIDRTHRIGQQKKVFAYKMICKDSVEEKILRLQERKKNLAADLISEESGFIKKLTEEDIAWLFA